MSKGLLMTVQAAAALAVLALTTGAPALAASGPEIREQFGSVDPPCPAAPSSPNAGSCVAHVFLQNTGGAGSGVVTINVPLKGATQPGQCHAVIPPTGAGEYVDASCKFDMPPGAQVQSAPSISDISVSGPAGIAGSSGGLDLSSLAVLALAMVTSLLAVGTFIVAQAARRAANRPADAGFRSQPAAARPSPAQPGQRDDSYTLPALPR